MDNSKVQQGKSQVVKAYDSPFYGQEKFAPRKIRALVKSGVITTSHGRIMLDIHRALMEFLNDHCQGCLGLKSQHLTKRIAGYALVGPDTARNGLRLLEEHGFIEIESAREDGKFSATMLKVRNSDEFTAWENIRRGEKPTREISAHVEEAVNDVEESLTEVETTPSADAESTSPSLDEFYDKAKHTVGELLYGEKRDDGPDVIPTVDGVRAFEQTVVQMSDAYAAWEAARELPPKERPKKPAFSVMGVWCSWAKAQLRRADGVDRVKACGAAIRSTQEWPHKALMQMFNPDKHDDQDTIKEAWAKVTWLFNRAADDKQALDVILDG